MQDKALVTMGVEPHAQRLAWLQTWAERAESLEAA